MNSFFMQNSSQQPYHRGIVRKTFLLPGDEPIPLEVDGEAWLQRPGIVKIEHKNTVQVLAKDKVTLNNLYIVLLTLISIK